MVGVNFIIVTENKNHPPSALKDYKKTKGHKRAITESEYKHNQELQKVYDTDCDVLVMLYHVTNEIVIRVWSNRNVQ